MTQHNSHQTNVAIASVGDIQQLTGGNVKGASAGIAPSPLSGAQGAHALPGQESEARAEDGHKPD